MCIVSAFKGWCDRHRSGQLLFLSTRHQLLPALSSGSLCRNDSTNNLMDERVSFLRVKALCLLAAPIMYTLHIWTPRCSGRLAVPDVTIMRTPRSLGRLLCLIGPIWCILGHAFDLHL
ncbi:hypothetical protein B0H21DRAFT_550810 [Amylocystis lapponica]|nr:hypothetical protein B0H21DRAFT_550810 [Amylocystis lapponica]